MILVDASVYIFRAYHALPDSLTGSRGQPLNVVYGFGDFICSLLEQARPTQVGVAFDESLASSFRNEFYPAYKANRESAPPELKQQIGHCQRLCHALGLTVLVSDRYEADDLIGSLVALEDGPVSIVSSDKDLTQLLRPGDVFWDFARGLQLDCAAVQERFGVRCEQMVDYLALVGDPVDNIPGVAGVGAKTAAAILAKYPDIDAIYADLDGVESLDFRGAKAARGKLAAGREQAALSRRLATIVRDAPLSPADRDLRWSGADSTLLNDFCDELGLGQRLRGRLLGLQPPAP